MQVNAVRLAPTALITTLPCFTEAMYLLHRANGIRAQDELWGLLEDGLIVLHDTSVVEHARMRILMRQYADSPMDFADASLVALAEALHVRQIFTVDRHFHAYLVNGKEHFIVIP
jgi:predicted nucleic acid-binding protein